MLYGRCSQRKKAKENGFLMYMLSSVIASVSVLILSAPFANWGESSGTDSGVLSPLPPGEG